MLDKLFYQRQSVRPSKIRLRLLSLENRINPVANDNFADAAVLQGQFDSRIAANYGIDIATNASIPFTGESGEPNHAGLAAPIESAWFRWVAPISAPTTIDIQDFSFSNTVIAAVYTGSAVNSLTEVASASNDFAAAVTFNAVVGTEYSIAIDGAGAAAFDFELILSCYSQPANDNFAGAIALSGAKVPVALAFGTSSGSTGEAAEPDHGAGLNYFGFPVAFNASTWFTWTAPTTGAVQLKLESSIDFGSTSVAGSVTGLAVYTGSAIESLTLVNNSFGISGFLGANDDFLFSGATVSFNSVAGTTYRIAAAGAKLFPESHVLKLINYAAPGAIPIDGTVYVVGTTDADVISVVPAGDASSGLTGVSVKLNSMGKSVVSPTHAMEIYAGAGNNVTIVADSVMLPVVVDFASGNDRYQGGNGATTVYAGDGNNIVRTGGGDDHVIAGKGRDDIQTAGGSDFIRPGDGDNRVTTGDGDDYVFFLPSFTSTATLSGINIIDVGSGDDIVDGDSSGLSDIRGGAGNDNLHIGGTGKSLIIAGDGDDNVGVDNGTSNIQGGAGDDFIATGSGNNVIDGGAGDDVINVGTYFFLGTGINHIQAGAGDDVVHVSSNGAAFVNAGAGDDEVVVGYKPPFFFGAAGQGSGIVIGGAGDDVLLGGPAADTLLGDNGNDLIAGGLGADVLVGGAGNDVVIDGTVRIAAAGDSLRQALSEWNPGSPVSYVDLRSRLVVNFNSATRDILLGGSGNDWFWSNDPLDILDRVPGETRN